MSGRRDRLRALEAQGEQRRLSKDEFLQPKIHEDDLYIAGMDGTIRVRSLTHRVRQEIRQRAKFGTPEYDDDLFTVLCIVHSLVDPQLTEEDVEALRDQNFTVWDEICTQLSVFNLLGATANLKKGSSETPNTDSASG